MMGTEKLEQHLERARFKHLSESTLVSYNDNQLDEVGQALADAHLRLCLICEQRLTFLKEESEALESYVITKEDKASIDKLLGKSGSRLAVYIAAELKRLRSYIEEVRGLWKIPHRKLAMRGDPQGSEIWKYESKDGVLTVRALLNKKGDLTVQFSASEPRWENFCIHFRLGSFHKDVILKRRGNKVTARVLIPYREIPQKKNDISLDVTSES